MHPTTTTELNPTQISHRGGPVAAPTTPDRTLTNRANAQHSTGSRTSEGKDAVRLNADKHGLYSQTVVLPTEDRAAYETLGAALRHYFQPQNPEELDLVQTLQDARWYRARASALEINLLALATHQQLASIDEQFSDLDEDARQALAQASAFQANARTFDQLSRARARTERISERTLKQLESLRAQRTPEAPVKQLPPAPPAKTAGFVSSKPLPAIPPAPVTTVSPAPAPAVAPKNMPKFTGPLAKEHRRQWLRKNAAA